MNTIVFLVITYLAIGGTVPPRIVIQEMPNIQMCESVGKSVSNMLINVKWTCIEGSRG